MLMCHFDEQRLLLCFNQVEKREGNLKLLKLDVTIRETVPKENPAWTR